MGRHKRNLFKKMYLATRHALLKFYMSVNYSAQPFVFNESDRCLCLAPHQDDETLGMGGTLARFANNFDVICLTNGAKGFRDAKKCADVDDSRNNVINTRAVEFKKAMEIAKISNSDIFDIEDRSLAFGYNEFSKIDFEKYDYIFIPNLIDQHKDHKAVSYLLYKFLSENNVSKDFKIGFYEVWSALGVVNACVDISDYVDVKKSMLDAYKSQTEYRNYTQASLGLNAYRGLDKNMDFAESYLIISRKEFMKLMEDIYPIIK